MSNKIEKSDNKVIPIEEGKSINLEKLRESIYNMQNKAISLHAKLVEIENKKRAQLNEELSKQETNHQNIELISLLNNDLEQIEKESNDLSNIITESDNKLDDINMRIDNLFNSEHK